MRLEEIQDLDDMQLTTVLVEQALSWRVFRPSEVKWRSEYQKESYGYSQAPHFLRDKKKRPQTHMIDANPLPNFCASLDWISQVEKIVIEKHDEDNFVAALANVVKIDIGERLSLYELRLLITATARQRAEACLLVLQKT